VVWQAGLSRSAGNEEWLVDHRYVAHSRAMETARIVVAIATDDTELARSLARALSLSHGELPSGVLLFGTGSLTGRIGAACRTVAGFQSFHNLTILAPGLLRVQLANKNGRGVEAAMSSHAATRGSAEIAQSGWQELWSRTIGALEEATWRQLAELHVVVVGCGRSGSLVADGLARLGASAITLIDPDRLEPHNLGEMALVGHDDVGKAKAEAVAARLRQAALRADAQVTPLARSIFTLCALHAVKTADVLFCCVDNAAARLACAFLATSYLKPLIDIGTGVLHNAPTATRADDAPGDPPRLGPADYRVPGWRMGADVRLVLPGLCLRCLGGIAGADALAAGSIPANHTGYGTRFGDTTADWQQQRAGSLRSLNGVAVNLALRLLEDFIAGRITESAWLHLDYDDTGIPTLEHPTAPTVLGCNFCSLSACGDAALSQFVSMFPR